MQRVESGAKESAGDGREDQERKERNLLQRLPEANDERDGTANNKGAADQLAPEDVALFHEDGDPFLEGSPRRDGDWRLLNFDYGGLGDGLRRSRRGGNRRHEDRFRVHCDLGSDTRAARLLDQRRQFRLPLDQSGDVGDKACEALRPRPIFELAGQADRVRRHPREDRRLGMVFEEYLINLARPAQHADRRLQPRDADERVRGKLAQIARLERARHRERLLLLGDR